MNQVWLDSEAALVLELLKQKEPYESLALMSGDRVFLLTIEGEFPAHVVKDWFGEDLLVPVRVNIDCDSWGYARQFHRSVFRAFTALDHIANV